MSESGSAAAEFEDLEASPVAPDSLQLGRVADAWLQKWLHALCQPLMALDCLLYVHREQVSGESLEAAGLRTVIAEGLIECGRMMVLVREMQEKTK